MYSVAEEPLMVIMTELGTTILERISGERCPWSSVVAGICIAVVPRVTDAQSHFLSLLSCCM